jgi:hypothetical protein
MVNRVNTQTNSVFILRPNSLQFKGLRFTLNFLICVVSEHFAGKDEIVRPIIKKGWQSKQRKRVLPVKADKLSKYSRPVIASLLISGGMLQLAAPVLAEGTAAGTQITNTATASYEDPTDSNKPLNTFSNTVKVAVAEVAGITVVADTFAVVKGSGNSGVGAEAGDKVNFDYIVTNVGNDATQLRIPGTASITSGDVEQVQYFDTATSTWVNISSGTEFISPSKLPGQSIKVRVVAAVLPGTTANTVVKVTLGNTTTSGAQNVTRDATGGDVFTVDNTDTSGAAGEVAGVPENGVREASASQEVTVGATPEAFATVTKVHGVQNPGANPNILTDDTLTYTLGLKVASQADVPTTSNKIAADLAATTINLDSNPAAKKVLVSDAVPQYTTAQSVTAPAGWTAVYTTTSTATNANAATWLSIPGTGAVAVPAGATRVGFVADGPIAKGTTTPGMSITVLFSTMPVEGGNVANIAQVFGSTDVNGVLKPVYDESGDNKPNNYNDNGTPAIVDPVTGNPVVSTGVVDPTAPGVTDTNNNNTGTGDAGEPNVVAVAPPGQAGILNGTSNTPGAVGPTGNNDDFTNISAPIPATVWVLDANGNYVPSPIDPGAIPFSNTFQTAVGSPTGNVDLLPVTPATPLPTGTKVTISYGSTSKVYSFDGTKFVDVVNGVATTTAATPLIVPNVVAGTKVNYGVDVDLPAGTPQLAGYSVPVTAFVDVNGDGLLGATEPQNQTIDRVYTGYLKLTKEAQITDANGGLVEAFTAAPTKKAQPGQSIEYKITYTNISEVAPANSGSVTLNAAKIKVTEDGNAAPNNWAPITTHKATSATDSNNGVITFDAGASNNSTPAVAVYQDVVAGPLGPQSAGSFRFTRVVK